MISNHCIEADYESMSTDRYAVLRMGRLDLLIPQHQVHILEPSIDVQRSQGESVGWITLADIRSPVYCLSENLRPIVEVPADRHICVLLNRNDDKFGLLCNQVSLFEPIELNFKPVPECMRLPNIPLRGLVIHDEKVLYVTSAQDLLTCLSQKQSHYCRETRGE